jgi:hypothetical protein
MGPFSHHGRGVGRRGVSFGDLRGWIWRIHGGLVCRVWVGIDLAAVSWSGWRVYGMMRLSYWFGGELLIVGASFVLPHG